MRIEEIDKNFSRKNGIAEPRLIWMDVKEPPLEVYGVIFDEKAGCYVRMPMEVATQVSEWVSDLNCNTYFFLPTNIIPFYDFICSRKKSQLVQSSDVSIHPHQVFRV